MKKLYRRRPARPPFSPFLSARVILFSCFLCLFVANPHAADSWVVDGQVVQTLELQTSNADTNALYVDGSRSMRAKLSFAPEVSSYSTGLFRAMIPDEEELDFFVFNEDRMSIALCPDNPSLGFEAGNMAFYGNGTIRFLDDSSYISFEERILEGGGWSVSSVAGYGNSILNQSYADARYIQQTTGITTNYTLPAGDTLVIQNGVITAINP